VVFVKLPEIPVMVTVTVPVAAMLLAASVNVLVLRRAVGVERRRHATGQAGCRQADAAV